MFLIAVDEEHQWHRYHPLFAQFLRSRLKATHKQDASGETLAVLHIRASLWYEQHHLPPEAIAHALVAEDFARVAHLVEQVTKLMVARGELLTLFYWLALLPDATVRQRPRLCLSHTHMLLSCGQVEAANVRLHDAEQSLREHGEDMHPKELRLLHSEIEVTRASFTYFYADVSLVSELCREPLPILPKDHTLCDDSKLNLESIYWLDGDVAKASVSLTKIRDVCHTASNVSLKYAALAYSAQVNVIQGHLHEANGLYHEALHTAKELDSEREGKRLYLGIAMLHYQWNELEEAARYLRQATAFAERKGNTQVLLHGNILLARTLQAQGETDAACELMQQMVHLAQQHESIWRRVARPVLVCQARLWLANGNLVAAGQWMQESTRLTDNGATLSRSAYICEVEEITHVRVYLAQSKYDEALKVLTRLQYAAEADSHMGHVLEILVLKALTYQAQGNSTSALSVLTEALKLAEPEGYMRLFVDEGPPMAVLLSQIRATCKNTSYVDTLLAAFKQPDEGSPAIPVQDKQQGISQALIDPLTEQESKILKCLFEGMSNKQIAQQLVIAETTVKWHLKNIYGKLGVHNRTQAILKASSWFE